MANYFLNEDYNNNNNNNNYTSWNEDVAAAAALQYQYNNPLFAAALPPCEEITAGSASRSHSEAEKRRRDRINAQLSTLRKLIPKSEKLDKAALLGQVVEHVKELSTKAKEVSKLSTMPTEMDEVNVDFFNQNSENNNEEIYIKASICCDDRPELFAELNNALKGLGLTIVEADLTTLGGRMKTIFVLCAKDDNNLGKNSLKQSVKLVLSRIVVSSSTTNYSARSKRQRFFYPNSQY